GGRFRHISLCRTTDALGRGPRIIAPFGETFMLLRGLTWLVLFQLLGTALNVLLVPVLPGPIIGMVLLFVALLLRGRAGESLQVADSCVLRYLPVLLVPPAVGVMVYTEAILRDFWAIVGVLVLYLLLSLLFTGWLMQRLIGR